MTPSQAIEMQLQNEKDARAITDGWRELQHIAELMHLQYKIKRYRLKQQLERRHEKVA